ncbi:MAG: inositol monophosphatase family protein [Ignavibacteriales bacterium]|nr:inositol monophosphatase family protein [Ignavibacteriales bacterium]
MFKEFEKTCSLLAQESSKIIKQYFRQKINVDYKSDNSPVSTADLKAEEIMRNIIEKEFPGHGILGEEFGHHKPNAEYQWILDPIDGTKSFVCGSPQFGTLIALTKNGEPILGVINLPMFDHFLIGDNSTAKLNDEIVKIRECNSLKDATLLFTDSFNVEKYQDIEKFKKLISSVRLYRDLGDCYGYYLLCTGYADIMIDPIMNYWDLAALIPIVKGAGGTITDIKGNNVNKKDSVIAASTIIHPQVLEMLS